MYNKVVVFLFFLSLIIVTSSFYYVSPFDLYSELGLDLQMCFPQFLLMYELLRRSLLEHWTAEEARDGLSCNLYTVTYTHDGLCWT